MKELIEKLKNHLGFELNRKGVAYCEVYEDEWKEVFAIYETWKKAKDKEEEEARIHEWQTDEENWYNRMMQEREHNIS